MSADRPADDHERALMVVIGISLDGIRAVEADDRRRQQRRDNAAANPCGRCDGSGLLGGWSKTAHQGATCPPCAGTGAATDS